MAEFSQKRGKHRDDNPLSSAVDFLLANARLVLGVGGAAVLGIATLAVKRLIDRATSPPDKDDVKAEQKSIEESWQELSLLKASTRPQPKQRRNDLSQPQPSSAQAPHAPEPEPPRDPMAVASSKLSPSAPTPLCLTLQERLLMYYQNHVVVSESDITLAKQLAGDIAHELQNFLRSKFPELPFGDLSPNSTLHDGLEAVAADRTCLLVPLVLEPNLWNFIPGEDTIANDPSYWMIRRTQLEYFPRGSSPWDRFMVGGYLSSNIILEVLRKVLVGSVNWPAIGGMLDCLIRPGVVSEELLLEVQHDQLELSIVIFPTAESEDRALLAKPQEGLLENLWQQDFYKAEVSKLQELDSADSGARCLCLQLLQGICRHHPSLNRLSVSHLAQVILHLSESQTDWAQDSLADRFLQVIVELIGYLEEGSLPCYFNQHINLFSRLQEEEIDDMGFALYSAVTAPELLLS
ncbi:mitochondrial dynamics protein MID49 [Dromiciops gliroides]|uniref:mitochondrial dynamics protein MID49 n=1 Tax=Dromiciops gliroides TaxID=33562 RepID=UPI001CC3B32D|nr:mitochondrial dynamics protein MID49 [Dromiciops gliroides]XP_043831737.1 mitochondrial dynamics protein MID49 [Dromiciops gliroides]